MKIAISKEYVACPLKQRLCGYAIFDVCNRIYSRKRKSSGNRFCLFIYGPGGIFKRQKIGKNSCDTVPLRTKTWTANWFYTLPILRQIATIF